MTMNMNTAATVPMPSAGNAAGVSARSLFGGTTGAMPTGDAFAGLLMQLLGGNAGVPTGDALFGAEAVPEEQSALWALFAENGEPLLPETDGRTAGAQTFWPLMQALRRKTEQQGSLNTDAAAELLALMQALPADTGAQPAGAEATAELLPTLPAATLAGEKAGLSVLAEQLLAETARQTEPAMTFERVIADLAHADPEQAQAELFPAEQLSYGEAVRQLRRTLAAAEPADAAEALNVEALQADVASGRFMPDVTAARAEQAARELARSVTEQVRTGVLEHLGAKDEFVLRLKPEGLGEITVRLSEQEGRVVLSLAASSPQVARLLTDEAASLQNALRPLQVEVREIVTATHSTGAEQFAFAGQSFSGERRQNGGAQADRPYYAVEHGARASAEPVAALTTRRGSAIDAYI